MTNKQKKVFQDPTAVLQAAIEELEVFTQPDASRLEVNEEGRLVAAQETHLERVVGLARSYLGPLLSGQVRQEQEKKLSQIKQALLQARDIIQTHSPLIEKFKQGDDSQRKLAECALTAIQRYNAVVEQDSTALKTHYNIHNYERNRLLSDQEIKGLRIELPYTISVKYDSHPDVHPAQKMLQTLSATLVDGAVKKQRAALSTTHKKSTQFIIDIYQMKAIRWLQSHFEQQDSMLEVLQLVKQTPIDIEEENEPGCLTMRQFLEIGPGSWILLTAAFKRHSSDGKLMIMPVLDRFSHSFHITHTGFPYPSQHTSWALADKWVEAHPLRSDQAPLFQQIEQRKKNVLQQLLFDSAFMQKVRQNYKLKREVFDQHRELFIPLHRQLQETLRQGSLKESPDNIPALFDAFYQEVAQAPSAFDILVYTQQQILDLFVKKPLQDLETEWLENENTLLRIGTPQEKFQAACQYLEEQRQQVLTQLDASSTQQAYIRQQGALVGEAFQSIVLQYQSEKMGFAPPFLSDFERKLQVCAFQQLLVFMEECERGLDVRDPAEMKSDLFAKWSKDLHILQSPHIEEEDLLSLSLANELEVYFNSRFYTLYPRRFPMHPQVDSEESR
jgi:hypothetical protein